MNKGEGKGKKHPRSSFYVTKEKQHIQYIKVSTLNKLPTT